MNRSLPLGIERVEGHTVRQGGMKKQVSKKCSYRDTPVVVAQHLEGSRKDFL